MKKQVLFLAILSVVGCATKSSNSSKSISSLKNSDFKPAKEIKYNRKKDKVFVEKGTGLKNNILKLESLDRAELYDDFKVDTPLDELSKNCYEKEFEDAKELIQELEEEYRSNIIFWNQVATCFVLEKEYRKALLFYNKALEFNASYAPVLNNIGVMYEYQNEDEKALISYKKAAKKDKYARTPKLNIAFLYLKYGLHSKAKSILRGLHNINQSDHEVANAYAISLLMEGNSSRALKIYSLVPKGEFEKPKYGLNYALAKFMSNRRSDAINVFEDIDISKKDKSYAYYKKVKKTIGVK